MTRICLVALALLFISQICKAGPLDRDVTVESKLSLVNDGKSSFEIVLPALASPSQKRGASELQEFISQMSGAKLPIVTDDQPLPEHAILIGPDKYTEAAGIKADLGALGPEGFVMKTQGGHLAIIGSPVRGAMYGCTSFLEELGVRWFTPTVTRVPHRPTITLDALDERQVPDFEYREPYIAEAMQKDWASRLRNNGNSANVDASTGGKIVYHPFVHSFDALIPRALYEQHPQYFPLVNGKRVNGYVQRCLSNPEVLKIAIAGVKKWIAENPQALVYSVSQNDTANFCQCDQCKAIESRYGGTHSGVYLWFVNQIAEAIEADHPDKLIDTLAYQFTEAPPSGIVPRKNVRVRLCPIWACEAHPYEHCSDPQTVAFVKNLQGWAKITDTLYIWHYNTDFAHYLMPFPDFAQFSDSIRLYKRSGVRGIFFEGDAYPGSCDGELRAYVMAHLLWNSQLDANALIDDWMQGVYGPAAPPMRQWFDLLQQKVNVPDKHLHIYQDFNAYFLPQDVISTGDRLFDEAQKLAQGNDTASQYVAKARLSLRYVKLMQAPDAAQLASLLEDLHKFGINRLAEGQTMDAWEKALRARIGSK